MAAEVRAVMARRSLSGVKLAAAIGLSQTQISKRLKSAVPISVDDLAVIAQALAVPVATLVAPLDEQTVTRDATASTRGRRSRHEPDQSGPSEPMSDELESALALARAGRPRSSGGG